MGVYDMNKQREEVDGKQTCYLTYWLIVQERNGLEKSIWESPTNKKVIEIVGMIEIAQETLVHI